MRSLIRIVRFDKGLCRGLFDLAAAEAYMSPPEAHLTGSMVHNGVYFGTTFMHGAVLAPPLYGIEQSD